MFAIVAKILEWASKGAVQNFMLQAGLTVVIFQGLDIVVTQALDYAIGSANSLPVDVLNLALLAGLDDFFYIIGSAILTRIAITTAMQSLGLKLGTPSP